MKRIILQKRELDNPFRVKKIKRIIKKITPIFIVLALLIALAIFLTGGSSSSSVITYIFNLSPFKSDDDRVNVLLLGMAGGRHDGATLTDTILVASYNLENNNLYIISIPRDLWLPSFSSKANTIYQIGIGEGDGLGLTKTVMGNVVGLPIHYGLRVDFKGFIEAIDILGGIDVEVERSFDDYLYPIEGKENDLCGYTEEEREFTEEEAEKLNIEPGKMKVFISEEGEIATDSAQEDKGYKYFSCRYEHIHFDEGKQNMDGETALKFVRSRHGSGGEGSDFARSKRQEKIIQAIRNKVLSLETLSDPKKIGELIDTLGKSIDTDISVRVGVEFFKLSKKLAQTQTIVLDDSKREGLPEDRSRLLINPPSQNYGGSYVLVSEDDDFTIIHDYIKKILEEEEKNEEPSSPRPGN
ncbi:MAG: LCP family protein [Candidatus Daviesbacteria bacterium]|nr:LCP family protein [Candidatus Daviesbacteria bacterium]